MYHILYALIYPLVTRPILPRRGRVPTRDSSAFASRHALYIQIFEAFRTMVAPARATNDGLLHRRRAMHEGVESQLSPHPFHRMCLLPLISATFFVSK